MFGINAGVGIMFDLDVRTGSWKIRKILDHFCILVVEDRDQSFHYLNRGDRILEVK